MANERARFLQQRVEQARIAAQEAEALYWQLLRSSYHRTFRLLVRNNYPHIAAYTEIRGASEGDVDSMRTIRSAFKWRHRR